MGHTKYKAGSKVGNKLARRGRSLDARPPGEANTGDADPSNAADLIAACPFKEGDRVQIADGDTQGVEGIVRWRGVQHGAVVLGVSDSARRSKSLVFAKADDCAILD